QDANQGSTCAAPSSRLRGASLSLAMLGNIRVGPYLAAIASS
ncbi:hypothetical protein PC115_g22996, partial [Phytophthora cactorum]